MSLDRITELEAEALTLAQLKEQVEAENFDLQHELMEVNLELADAQKELEAYHAMGLRVKS